MVGRQALEIELLKGGFEARTSAEKREHLRGDRPGGISVSRGCELMGLARPPFYDVALFRWSPPSLSPGSARFATSSSVTAIGALGRRRATRVVVVNSKKLRR